MTKFDSEQFLTDLDDNEIAYDVVTGNLVWFPSLTAEGGFVLQHAINLGAQEWQGGELTEDKVHHGLVALDLDSGHWLTLFGDQGKVAFHASGTDGGNMTPKELFDSGKKDDRLWSVFGSMLLALNAEEFDDVQMATFKKSAKRLIQANLLPSPYDGEEFNQAFEALTGFTTPEGFVDEYVADPSNMSIAAVLAQKLAMA